MTDWTAVTKVVNDRMQDLGITQRDLAERSGLSVATLRKIQHGQGQSRTRSTLANLSRALGYRDDYLWRIVAEAKSAPDVADVTDLDDLRADLANLRERVEALETQLNR